MRLIEFRQYLAFFSLCLLLANFSPVAISAASEYDGISNAVFVTRHTDALMLAQSSTNSAEDEQPRSGSLVLPIAAEDKKSKKQCMTICQRWGQNCVIDAVRGVRKCRRTCKEFGQECF